VGKRQSGPNAVWKQHALAPSVFLRGAILSSWKWGSPVPFLSENPSPSVRLIRDDILFSRFLFFFPVDFFLLLHAFSFDGTKKKKTIKLVFFRLCFR
jgi:hypothetical protein